LESLSWKSGSPIYTSISNHGVPRCQEVSSDNGMMTPLIFMSPTPVRVSKDGKFKLDMICSINFLHTFLDKFNKNVCLLSGVQSSPVISIPQKGLVPPPSPARRNLFGSAPKTGASGEITHTPASTVTIATPAAMQALGSTNKQSTAVVLPPKTGNKCFFIPYFSILLLNFFV